jgi:polyphosphate kinase
MSEERYFNRELSWLAFDRRVLEEAQDERVPLLERCKFLAIVASNLDEFMMVRVAELRALAKGRTESRDAALKAQAAHDLEAIRASTHRLVADQYACWRESVRPALAAEGMALIPPAQWSDVDRETLRRLYHDQLEPVLTPLAVDMARPFPLVPNRGLVVAVQLVPPQGGARNALVAVPSGNRLVALVSAPGRFALVEDVVMAHLDSLFPGYRVAHRCLLRCTRDGSLEIDEDQAQDLLSEIEQELSSRDHGHAVRLELAHDADPTLREWLVKALDLDEGDVVPVDGPLDLTVLHGLVERSDRPDLRDAPLPVKVHPREWEEPFARLRSAEVLLHHPFESFQPVVDLVAAAAEDPKVLAIKMTLYRVGGDSPIVKSLIGAAQSGKQVTVLIELKARFDEAHNIRWARRLEEAGAHVIYGLVGLKVHAKLMMIIRREDDGIHRYCHLGTGNYNHKTARLYTDLSYLTANEAIGRDVAALFNMLTGYSQPPEWERLSVAPMNLRKNFREWIRREADNARAGRPARIVAKCNSLVDVEMCDELYAASQAGVDIDLIVRGMCILRPGVPGLSERIRVRSIVGRLLEHHRIYWFANHAAAGPRPVVAIASADWMSRNLDRRVECLTRIEDPALQERLQALAEIFLADEAQARILGPDGVYRRASPGAGVARRSAVDDLVAEAAARELPPGEGSRIGPRFKPARKKDG